MVRAKRQYGVLASTGEGYALASQGEDLADKAACDKCIRQNGVERRRYQPVAFLGSPVIVEVETVKKRKVISTEPNTKLLDKGEQEPVE